MSLIIDATDIWRYMSRRVTEGTVTPPYDVDNDVQYDGCQYIGTYTSHREFTLTRFRDILPEMQ